MTPPATTQQAKLTDGEGNLVAEVDVPAFPYNPDIVLYEDRAFGNGMIGYGVTYLTYTEQTTFVAKGPAPAGS